jgi:hypothetical protein
VFGRLPDGGPPPSGAGSAALVRATRVSKVSNETVEVVPAAGSGMIASPALRPPMRVCANACKGSDHEPSVALFNDRWIEQSAGGGSPVSSPLSSNAPVRGHAIKAAPSGKTPSPPSRSTTTESPSRDSPPGGTSKWRYERACSCPATEET